MVVIKQDMVIGERFGYSPDFEINALQGKELEFEVVVS